MGKHGRLMLKRGVGQRVLIGPHITVEVAAISGHYAQLAITAPPETIVAREELAEMLEPGGSIKFPSAGRR